VIGNAGEVNTGLFDPLDEIADLCDEYGAWLHVDGAFGLFARVSPRTAELAAGVERAHSVISDGHKWLNVPFDCGFAFVRDPELLTRTFAAGASYLPEASDDHPIFAYRAPELSRRRARSRSGQRSPRTAAAATKRSWSEASTTPLAFVKWRTTSADVDLILETLRDLGSRLRG
jgi:Pyridoxal-dependent decarboxylase conserved domain